MHVTVAAIDAAIAISHPELAQLCRDVKVMRGRAQGRATAQSLEGWLFCGINMSRQVSFSQLGPHV